MEINSGENTTGRIRLKDGESAFFQYGKIQKGDNPEYGLPYAKADTFVIGRNGPVLEAWGGSCRVVALFEAVGKNGAVVHVDVADLWGSRHEELIDETLEAVPDLSTNSFSYVLGDTESSDPVLQTLIEETENWNENIAEYLRNKGMKNVKVFANGDGKDVRLDTHTGVLTIFDDNERLLLEEKLI